MDQYFQNNHCINCVIEPIPNWSMNVSQTSISNALSLRMHIASSFASLREIFSLADYAENTKHICAEGKKS
jgi:hypothetical protein